MGRFIFRLPDIGEGIAEAEIVAWHVKVGDRVEEDGPLADMMTDKATVEMESPVAGIVREIGGEVGELVAIGSPLVVIETEGGEDAEAIKPETTPSEPVRAEPVEAPSLLQPRKESAALRQAQGRRLIYLYDEYTPPPHLSLAGQAWRSVAAHSIAASSSATFCGWL